MRPDKTAVVCFTGRGCETALRIRQILEPACAGSLSLWCKKKNYTPPAGVNVLEESLQAWTGERFADSGLLIFVGATGIAVRSIAPHLRSKKTDPAVLCVDERGSYVISLVSGHIGGANAQAALLAQGLQAVPVITTATDLGGRFAVDVFAGANDLQIASMTLAKYVSAALLDGESISFASEAEPTGVWPEGLIDIRTRVNESNHVPTRMNESGHAPDRTEGQNEAGAKPPVCAFHIQVGIHSLSADRNTLPGAIQGQPEGIQGQPGTMHGQPAGMHALSGAGSCPGGILYLVPRVVTVGVGCRKDKDPAQLCAFVGSILAQEHIHPQAVERIATIDLKKEEPAVQALARSYRVPLHTYSAGQLRACEGEWSASSFVQETVGVDNVCERSAVLGSTVEGVPGRLIRRKTAENGMTVALAVREWRVGFE